MPIHRFAPTRRAGSATLTNDYVSLTPAAPNTLGWLWNNQQVRDMKSWEVDLEFHIGGTDLRGAGGGLAFWFTQQEGRRGPIYGQDDRFNGLGIFFDTFDPEEGTDEKAEPFVVAMMNYGRPLAQGNDPDYYKNQVGVCFADYRNLNHPARARIIMAKGRLQVWLDLEQSGHYQSCLQTEVGDERMRLPERGFFGITASTGAHGDAHVVYKMALARLDDD
eukprot:4403318-Prymnesium_polylepis.1